MKARKLDIKQMQELFATPKRSNAKEGFVTFSNIPLDGDPMVLRFLPDLDEENPVVWIASKTIHAVKDSSGKWHTLPCLTAHGEQDTHCPLCVTAAELYSAGDREKGKNFYKKKNFIAQALVVSDPTPDSEEYVNMTGKVAKVQLTKTFYERIISQCTALDNTSFVDDIAGCDYAIYRTKKDNFNNYDLSNFVRKESDIDYADVEDQLVELKSLLPVVNDDERVRVLSEHAFLVADLLGESVPVLETMPENDELLGNAEEIMDVVNKRRAKTV